MFGGLSAAVIGFFLIAVDLQTISAAFSCNGRPTGYYADVQSGCQVYHMCDGLGRQFSYTCPNATLFQQRMLICDHWYMVNCSRSEQDYSANLRIGRNMPFVDDSESNPYDRTPRPDLLSHPSEAEYNIIYRRGKAQTNNNANLVGSESDSKNNSSTDVPSYFLPSHWSTELSQQDSVTKPSRDKIFGSKKDPIKGKPVNVNYRSNFQATTPAFPQSVEATSIAPDQLGMLPPIPYQGLNQPRIDAENEIAVNFPSGFHATTPVYPRSVEATSVAPDQLGMLPPDVNEIPVNFPSNFQATTPDYPKSVESTSVAPDQSGILPPELPNEVLHVNFESNFKATTPDYPKSVESTSLAPEELGVLPPKSPSSVVYQSNFQATTPVYPKSVEATSQDPGEAGVLPPKTFENLVIQPSLSLDFAPPVVDASFKPGDHEEIEVNPPSKFYQPPRFEPDFTTNENHAKDFDKNHWEELRKSLAIPDYEFPLESVSRPSYDSVLSSFQVRASPRK